MRTELRNSTVKSRCVSPLPADLSALHVFFASALTIPCTYLGPTTSPEPHFCSHARLPPRTPRLRPKIVTLGSGPKLDFLVPRCRRGRPTPTLLHPSHPSLTRGSVAPHAGALARAAGGHRAGVRACWDVGVALRCLSWPQIGTLRDFNLTSLHLTRPHIALARRPARRRARPGRGAALVRRAGKLGSRSAPPGASKGLRTAPNLTLRDLPGRACSS